MAIERLSASVVPFVIAACALIILTSKKPMFEVFTGGIRQGFETAVKLFPTLCALCLAAAMLEACGMSAALAGLLSHIGIPDGLAGFLVMRPVSGAASTAMLTDIFSSRGADSAAGICASVLMASGDTLVYIISVYHGAAGIKKSRSTLAAALITLIVTSAAAIIVCGMMFG